MSNIIFLIIYLIFMILTYFWRFGFLAIAFEDGANIEGIGIAIEVLMFLSYAGMACVAYSRGKAIGKSYLVAFPIVGAVFDLILIFIPFVPTIMNIITIVLGMPDSKPTENTQPETSNT